MICAIGVRLTNGSERPHTRVRSVREESELLTSRALATMPAMSSPAGPTDAHGADELQREIDSVYRYCDDWMRVTHRGRIDLFRSLLDGLFQRGAIRRMERALDIGCNGGFFAKLMSDAGFRHVRGIDVSEADISLATRKFGFQSPTRDLTFTLTRAEDLPSDQLYDLILCTEVIEHTERPDLVVEKIKELVAPGGFAIVSLPNALSLPYLFSFVSKKVRGRPIDDDLRAHLSYPVYRALRIFGDDLEVVDSAGVNLFWIERLLELARGRAWFDPINRVSELLSRRWPLRYVSQFFFLVLQKPGLRVENTPSALRVAEGAIRFALDRGARPKKSEAAGTAELRILVACHGNICRSPLAHGLLQRRLKELGQGDRIQVDSAAITHLTAGRPPHPLAIECARAHGLSIEDRRARPFVDLDFDRYDRIFVMDAENRKALLERARSKEDADRVELLRADGGDVPDPIHGGPEAFEKVFQQIAAELERRLPSFRA
jgi:protein-tyrosine phosphatase